MKWISVKDELPPVDKDIDDCSIIVMVCVFDYGEPNNARWGYGRYDFDLEKWSYHVYGWCEQNDNDVLFWTKSIKTPRLECDHKQCGVISDTEMKCSTCNEILPRP